jgi:hypothetical protein
MRSRRALFAFIFLGGACSHGHAWQPVDPAALAALPARTLGVVGSTPEAFTVSNQPSLAPLAGVVGAMLAPSLTGAQVLRENNLADPAPLIAVGLSQPIARTYGLKVTAPKPTVDARGQPGWDTQLVLQVRTTRWSLDYFPGLTGRSRYRLFYRADLELRDTRDQRVLATGRCDAPTSGSAEGAPTYDELMFSKASLLRQKMLDAASYCARMFGGQLFGVPLPEGWHARDVLFAPPTQVPEACRLERTPAWQAADAATRRRLLFECLERERLRAPPPPAPSRQPSVD